MFIQRKDEIDERDNVLCTSLCRRTELDFSGEELLRILLSRSAGRLEADRCLIRWETSFLMQTNLLQGVDHVQTN